MKTITKKTQSVNRHSRSKRTAREKLSAKLVIRRAKFSDLPAIAKMSNGVREIENYPGQKMKANDFAHFVGSKDAFMLVAAAEKEAVGYITVYKSYNYLYLPYAVVRKDWRRHGVGTALLNEVEALAKKEKVEYILMSVYDYNSSVRKLLKSRGYVSSKKLVQYSKIITGKK